VRYRSLAIIVVLSLQAGILNAQTSAVSSAADRSQLDAKKTAQRDSNKNARKAPKKRGGKEILAERFRWSAPQIGDQLPDLTAYDADGKSVRLSSLEGKFTVIAFGCLT